MSVIFNWVLGPPRLSTQDKPESWFVTWLHGGGKATLSGVSVDENTALNYSAVWAATCIISETVASIPLMVYRRQGKGKSRDETHQVYHLLHDEPNPEMDAVTFWSDLVPDILNWGYGIAEIEWAADRKTIIALWPTAAALATPKRAERPIDGVMQDELYFDMRNPDGTIAAPIPFRRCLVVPGRMPKNGIGKGVISYARESIGAGLAVERFGATFFGNGARPGGFLSRPVGAPELSETGAERLLDSFNRKYQGADKANALALLREGMTYTSNAIPPEDAQFLQTRQHNITEIARWYRLPPHLLADLSRATFSNIEAELGSFLSYSMTPWFRKIEKAVERQLLRPDEKPTWYVEFLVDALLRADTEARARAHQIEFMNGGLTLNEWRAQENRNPLSGDLGDIHFVPANLIPIEKAVNPEPPPPPQPPPASIPPEPKEEKPTPAESDEGDTGNTKNESKSDGLSLTTVERVLTEMDSQRRQWFERRRQSATDALAADAMTRMVHREQLAAKAAAAKSHRFVAWLDSFYPKHQIVLSEAIIYGVQRYLDAVESLLDPKPIADAVAMKHCEESRQALLAACECQPDQLPVAIAAAVMAWDTRTTINLEEFIHAAA